MTPSALPSILAMIRMKARQGLGYEDIAVQLGLSKDHVRRFVMDLDITRDPVPPFALWRKG